MEEADLLQNDQVGVRTGTHGRRFVAETIFNQVTELRIHSIHNSTSDLEELAELLTASDAFNKYSIVEPRRIGFFLMLCIENDQIGEFLTMLLNSRWWDDDKYTQEIIMNQQPSYIVYHSNPQLNTLDMVNQ